MMKRYYIRVGLLAGLVTVLGWMCLFLSWTSLNQDVPYHDPRSPYMRYKSGKCRPLNLSATIRQEFNCVSLKTHPGVTPICIHDTKDDIYISKTISSTGEWERYTIDRLREIFASDSELQLIDIGANIGVYSLTAANWGRQVVAVEPVWENARRLVRSIQLGGFEDRITLLHNAVSNDYGTVIIKKYEGNMGGVHVLHGKDVAPKNTNKVEFILMDNILEKANFTKAVMKIDVESHEIEAFMYGAMLFDKIDISHVIMEWKYVYQSSIDYRKLLTFFEKRHYLPYRLSGWRLYTLFHRLWPVDVMWIKQS